MKVKTESWKSVLALSLAALGVVFGDIGTSPLYAVKECFSGSHAIAVNPQNVLGVLSLVLWSLFSVVCFKYVMFIMKADNRGEGGIFALLALIMPNGGIGPKAKYIAILSAVFGAALLYGDGLITPSISVLSAIEGLIIPWPQTTPFIVPLTCLVLILLFMFQYLGTNFIGKCFGPVMAVWFIVLAILGIRQIFICPQILKAFNPYYAIMFFVHNKFHGFIILGAVVLCITGGEALYADLGHFGRRAIRLAWLSLAWPGLMLNYLGQGAILLVSPGSAENPFYSLVPMNKWIYLPMVLFSTVATVIASQAMITGVYSLTQQAIQLGYLPRMRIKHTSDETRGQIYVPGVNYFMMIACLLLVVKFQSSTGLAGAYGIAVTATMGLTSISYFLVVTKIWKWSLWKAVPLLVSFLAFDLAFFSANLLKFFDGGWFTILVAAIVFSLMLTWSWGRKRLAAKRIYTPLTDFLEDLGVKEKEGKISRVPGMAVFLAISPKGVPAALLHYIKHSKSLHKTVVILTIRFLEESHVPSEKRIITKEAGEGFYRVYVNYGYMENPDIPAIMKQVADSNFDLKKGLTSYFLGRETIMAGEEKGNFISRAYIQTRKIIFSFMSRNAGSAAYYFNIPPGQVVELGEQITI